MVNGGYILVTCYLLLAGVEVEALIAPSAAFVEPILECCDSVSFDDMCRQTIPFRDNSVAEEILPNIQTRSLYLEFVLVASSIIVRIVQMKKTAAIDLFPSC